jgi:phage terminase large subunit
MRQFQNKIAESVYAVIVVQIERFGLSAEFEIQKSVIRHRLTGSEFHFYGIHRDIAEIKGFEGADIGWIEEGEGLTKEQWRYIEPTLRKDGAECWLLFNPRLVTDFAMQFKHDPENGVIVRHINYDENPFISNTMLRKIKRMQEADHEEYEHYYLGIPMSDDDKVIIKRSWVEASIDAHKKLGIEPAGSKRIGFDVADDGKDLCSQIHMHGIVATWGEHWKAGEDELRESCQRVYNKAIELGSDVSYDSIGVGALAGSEFKAFNRERKEKGLSGVVKYSKFIAGGAVINPDRPYIQTDDEKITNKDFFENLKAQAWWSVADRFRNTYNAVTKGMEFAVDDLISISSDMPNLANLVTELSTPRRDYAKDGRVKVESKEDLAKREVDSPNDADAFIMCSAPVAIDKKAAVW